jgi:hypothetical protein
LRHSFLPALSAKNKASKKQAKTTLKLFFLTVRKFQQLLKTSKVRKAFYFKEFGSPIARQNTWK